MEFYDRILDLRTKKGLTQKAAAEVLGITTRQYQRFESGEQKPGYDNLIRLADLFDVSLDYLTGRSDDDVTFCMHRK